MQAKIQTSVSRLYNSSLERIFKHSIVRRFAPGEKASIDQMKNLCNYFGNPQKKFKTLHIAGTNGKGCVSLKTANVLQKAGFKTGLFSSPHISSFRERISINQEKLQEEDVVNHAQVVLDAIDQKGFQATFSEIVTMIAFLEFAAKNVDIAVLECSMGGRLDPTNVVEKPEATAITSISYDHMEYLGSTLEAIAAEKAGIIKPGVPCVIGPTVTQDAVFRKANQMGGKLIQVKKKSFLKANQEVVEKLVESLGIPPSHQSVQSGIDTGVPCRLEKVPDPYVKKIMKAHASPIVYLDVCCNPSAVENVVKELTNRYPTQKIQVACGFTKNKDMTSILHFLATHKHVKTIHPITSSHVNVVPIQEMQQRIRSVEKLISSFERNSIFQDPISQGDIGQTLDSVLRECKYNEDILLVCGSYYLMKDVRQFFNFNDDQDQQTYDHHLRTV